MNLRKNLQLRRKRCNLKKKKKKKGRTNIRDDCVTWILLTTQAEVSMFIRGHGKIVRQTLTVADDDDDDDDDAVMSFAFASL